MSVTSLRRDVVFVFALLGLIATFVLLPSPPSAAAPSAIATIGVGTQPEGIGINPGTDRVYVANVVSNTVTVINAATNTVVTTIGVGQSPVGVGVNTVTNRIYVSNRSGGSVSVIDGSSNSVIATIPVAGPDGSPAVNEVTNRVYIPKRNPSNNISVIDGVTNTVIASTVGFGLEGVTAVAVNPVTNKFYATVQDRTFAIFDGATNGLLFSNTHADNPTPKQMVVDTSTNTVYATSSSTVSIFDGTSGARLGNIALGESNGWGTAINADLGRLYAVTRDGSLTAHLHSIDLATGTIVASTVAGVDPNGIAVHPGLSRIFVVNHSANTVTVVDEDFDLDGIVDNADNCPLASNPSQENFDGDTLGDACDPDDDNDLVNDPDEIGCGADPLDAAVVPERVDGPFAGVSDDGDVDIDEALPVGASAFDCDGDGYTGAAEDNVYSYIGQTDGDQKTCQEYDTNFTSIDPNQTAATPSLRWPSDFNSVAFPLDSFNRITILDITSFLAPVYYFGTDLGTNPGDVRWDLTPGPGVFLTDINIQDITAMIAPGASSGSPPMLGGIRAFGGPVCPWAPPPPPTTLFGDGADGNRTVAGTQTFDDTRTALSGSAAFGQPVVPVVSTAGLAPGDEVMIIQMEGTGTGLYELGIIQNVTLDTSVTLTSNLASAYTVGGTAKAQLLRVLHYQDVTVLNGGVVTANPWDRDVETGGVVAFRVSGTLTVAAGGAINVNGQGYQGAPTNSSGVGGFQGDGENGAGGQSTNASGVAGGGGCSNGFGNPAGGGGGGNGGPGISGNPGNNNNCDTGGAGGSTIGISDLSFTIALGGGGGSGGAKNDGPPFPNGGFGGNGGGVILAFASTATIDGTVSANGTDGGLGPGFNTAANGGGGAGGSIRLVVGSGSASAVLTAMKGSGGIYGGDQTQDGGDGGPGRIHVQYCQSFSGSGNPAANVEQIAC